MKELKCKTYVMQFSIEISKMKITSKKFNTPELSTTKILKGATLHHKTSDITETWAQNLP